VFGEAGTEASPVHTVGLHCHMEHAMDPAFDLFSTDPARLGDAMRCDATLALGLLSEPTHGLQHVANQNFPPYTPQQQSG